jgi:hypothetical protein
MRYRLFIVALGLWIGLNGWALSQVHAQQPDVTLAVTPATLALAAGETGQVVVTAAVPTTTQAITLTSFTNTRIQVVIADPVRTDTPLLGKLAWVAQLTRPPNGLGTGGVYFRADYVYTRVDGALVSSVAIAPLDVQERTPDAIQKVLTASLTAITDPLVENQPQSLYLNLSNLSNAPVTITRVTPRVPVFLDVTVQDVGAGLVLAPQQSRTLSVTLSARDAVQPGTHPVAFELEAAWQQAGLPVIASLALTRDVKVGVLLQSEIGQLIGIPSMLLIPGFLFVITVLMLRAKIWPKIKSDIEIKSPWFWVMAVAISFLALVIYPVLVQFVSGVLGQSAVRRDYISAYGLRDIAYAWFGAILFGFLFWVVWSVGAWARDASARKWQADRFPSTNDTPQDILNKLARNHKGFDLPEVEYKRGSQTQRVFALPAPGLRADRRWVTPRIFVDFTAGTQDNKKALDVLLNKPDKPDVLAESLNTLAQGAPPVAKVGWDTRGAILLNPKEVDVAAVDEQVTPSGDSFVAHT